MENIFNNYRFNLAIVLLLSLIARVYTFYIIDWTLLGADVGRMAIISHTWFLKGEITPDLRPYDMAESFFYFPGTLLLGYVFEFIGMNPIQTMTLFSLIFDILSLVVFYKLLRIFFNEKQSIIGLALYSFIFDIFILCAIFGLFSYAMGSFFFLLLVWQICSYQFKDKWKPIFVFIGIFGIIFFHWYYLINLMLFLMSTITYEFTYHKKLTKNIGVIKPLVLFGMLSFLLLSPYFLKFGKYFYLQKDPQNVVDILTFGFERTQANTFKKLEVMYFYSFIPMMFCSVLIASLIVFLWKVKDFVKNNLSVLVFFFIFVSLYTFTVYNEANFSRNVVWLWIPYTFAITSVFKKYRYLLAVPLFIFIQSPSILYFAYTLTYQKELIVPMVDFKDFHKAMDFIKEEVPENATFLIDGGGCGCMGASASYGERIFPLTSRKIFYFTNYCWAKYDRDEYFKRVDLYRRIGIEPDDTEALEELKNYNVTHVFVGSKSVGFHPYPFAHSENYEMIYNESGFQIFKIR